MTFAAHSQVLIIGGGPCGLTLSIDLGRRGIQSTLVDAKGQTAVNPQANATQARTMEHFRRLGFADEVRSMGLPKDYPTDVAYFTRYSKLELARFKLPSSAEAKSLARNMDGSWSTAELPHRVSQKYVEQVLRRHAEAEPLSSVNFGWRLIAFTEHPDRVEATIEDVVSGEQKQLSADYLIGVDGARSFVRRQLGIRYGGETGVQRDFFGGKMAAVYFRAPGFYDLVPHPRAWTYWAFNPQRRSFCMAVNGRDEFAFHTQLKPGEGEEIDEARARQLINQAMGAELDVEILSIDNWIAGHALVAESLGRDRIYIGGDAAHLFTPAGGLGYNTAVEDAVNLGWKLAAKIKGIAGDALLPSYASERQRLAIRNTGYARTFAESIGNFVPDPTIESDTAEGARAREEAGAYLNGHARREFNIPGITFGGRYDGSPVIVPDGAPPPRDAADVYEPTASPGGRVPHLWLEDGGSIFDTFGFDWTLLCTREGLPDVEGFRRAAEARGLDLKVVTVVSDAARSLYEADMILIRPDQIVGWRQTDAKAEPEKIFDRLLGFAPE